jgi:hypothetical protein
MHLCIADLLQDYAPFDLGIVPTQDKSFDLGTVPTTAKSFDFSTLPIQVIIVLCKADQRGNCRQEGRTHCRISDTTCEWKNSVEIIQRHVTRSRPITSRVLTLVCDIDKWYALISNFS